MITWLSSFMLNDNTKIIYLLSLILIANMIDFLFGWVNARFNKKVSFSSSKAIYGIMRKMVMFIVACFFVPVSLIVPAPIGIGALYVLLFGYLGSEINSILNHLKLTDDDKSTDIFMDFVKRIFSRKEDEQ